MHRTEKKCQAILVHRLLPHWIPETCSNIARGYKTSLRYLIRHMGADRNTPSYYWLCFNCVDRVCDAENEMDSGRRFEP